MVLLVDEDRDYTITYNCVREISEFYTRMRRETEAKVKAEAETTQLLIIVTLPFFFLLLMQFKVTLMITVDIVRRT